MNVHRNAAVNTRRSKPRRPAAPVEVTQVPDAVMRAARALLKGTSYTRVEVKSNGDVYVR